MAATVSLVQALYSTRQTGNPVVWPSGKKAATVAGVLSSVDLAKVTNKATLILEVSYDGGQNFNPAGSDPWTGNRLDKLGVATPPALYNTVPGQKLVNGVLTDPTHARAVVEPTGALSIGATIDFA